MAKQNDIVTSTKGFSSALVGCTPRESCGASALSYGIQCCQESTVPTVQALSSPTSVRDRTPSSRGLDDFHAPDTVYDLAATDASFEESRQIREATMKAHAEVSIRDRIEDSVRARPRTQIVLRAEDIIMVWNTNPPSKRGRWVGRSCVILRALPCQCSVRLEEDDRAW